MKKLKTIAIKSTILFIGMLLFSIALLLLISANVKSDLLLNRIPDTNEVVDSVVVHFIHGSIPKDNCDYKKHRLGGYLGGHIEIELDGKVFGFLYDSIPINYFPKNKYNSQFEMRTIQEWETLTTNDKITSIHLPINKYQKSELALILGQFMINEPYDYALFGQRCTSSTAKILSDSGILNKFSSAESIIAFFYPRTFRFTLLNYAEKNNLRIEIQTGITCHSWE